MARFFTADEQAFLVLFDAHFFPTGVCSNMTDCELVTLLDKIGEV